jgi:hypothetical protein
VRLVPAYGRGHPVPPWRDGKGGVNVTLLKNKTSPEGLIVLPTSC